MDDAVHQNLTQTNEFGVVFTSTNPLTGYRYASQQTQPISSDRATASSIFTQSIAMASSIPMSRTASSNGHPSSSTAVSPGSDSDSDTETSSASSHPIKYATHKTNVNPRSMLHTPTITSISLSPFTAPPIILLVGGPASPSKETQPVPFYIHENILTSISPFFRAAFELKSQAGFSESISRTMKLPEDRPEDFAYLLQWVYWQLSNAPFNAVVFGQPSQLDRKEDSGSSDLGLWHPSIDIPLSHYHAYRAMKKADKVLTTVVQKMSNGAPYLSSVDAMDWHFALAQQGTQHVQSQPQAALPHTLSNDVSRDNEPVLADAGSSTSQQQQKPELQRPPPPAFGPLIRLYILADKYSLPESLKRDICSRVRDVGKEGRCMPDADDIALLWESLLEDAGQDHVEGGAVNLKDTVLGMYEALSMKSFRGLFFPAASASPESTRAETGTGSQTRHVLVDDNQAWQWHPLFMRDLLVRKFEGEGDSTNKLNDSGGGGGRGGMIGEDTFLREMEQLGRARRRERFPSLYGVGSRSGEGVQGSP